VPFASITGKISFRQIRDRTRIARHSNEDKIMTAHAAKVASLPPARRLKKNARQQSYRERQRRHEIVVLVPVDEAILGYLVRLRWLNEVEAGCPKKIAAAIRELLKTSARV
jgi:hypothetical protein